jgi:hypothetical protein
MDQVEEGGAHLAEEESSLAVFDTRRAGEAVTLEVVAVDAHALQSIDAVDAVVGALAVRRAVTVELARLLVH